MNEFIEGKEKTKKVTYEQKKWEKIIFDPRTDSKYKKLIADGIIEERNVGEGEQSEEKIKFSQEKIIKIIYSEFQKKSIKRLLKNYIYVILVALLLIFGMHYFIKYNTNEIVDRISEALDRIELNQNFKKQIVQDSYNLTKTEYEKYDIGIIKMITIFLIFWILFSLGSRYLKFWGSMQISNDLPSRFIKEKFSEITLKVSPYFLWPVIGPLFIYIIYRAFFFVSNGIYDLNILMNEIINLILPILIIWGILGQLVAGAYVVIKNSKNPEDAYGMFGRKEVKHTFINFSPLIPFLIILFYLTVYVVNDFYNSSDIELIEFKNEWLHSEGVQYLKSNFPAEFENIEGRLWNQQRTLESNEELISWISLIFKKLIIILPLVFVIAIILEWKLGFLIEKYLKKKLGKP